MPTDNSAAFLQSIFANNGVSGDPALNAFSRTIGQNNYYKMGAAPLLGAKFDTSTWSPTTTLGVTAAQSFLGGLLNMYGQRQEAEQLNKVAAIMPQIYADPAGVANPGVDPEAFEGLRVSAARENIINDLFNTRASDAIDRQVSAHKRINQDELDLKRKATEGVDFSKIPGSAEYDRNQDLIKIEREYSDKLLTGNEAQQALASNKAAINIMEALKHDSPTAAGDAIVQFAKLEDPKASVREGDELRVSDPGGPLGQLAQFRNEMVQKGKLLPEAKIAMARLTSSMLGSQFKAYDQLKDAYLEATKQYGASPERVKYLKPADLSSYLEQPQSETSDLAAFIAKAKAADLSREQAKAAWTGN